MENKNDIKEELLNHSSINKTKNNPDLNLQTKIIKYRKFIEDIFKYSEESNELIPKFKENSKENIKDFINYLIQISKEKIDEILKEEEKNLICYNLRQLKEIFLNSIEILEEIQFNQQYYNEEYKEYGIIGILFNLYINTSINNIKIILEEIFYIINSKNNLSKILLTIIFKKIGKEYFWGNNNNNYDNFLKYLNLIIFLLCGNRNQFYNYLSYDLKKCKGIKGDINEPIKINEKSTLNFQINFRIKEYNNNQNSKLISIILSNNQLDLILNNININLYINNKLRESMNFNNIKYNTCYKLNFTLLNFIEDKILTISLCELNKSKEDIIIKSTYINEKNLKLKEVNFFENFEGDFIPISCFKFNEIKIIFEDKNSQNNIYNLGNNKYWNKFDDKVFNNQYENNIYLIGGIKIILPLFEKILLYKDNKEIFEKLLFLIKEILIDKPNNQINASNNNFFEIFSIFILNIDDSYFKNGIFGKLLFELSDNFIKQINENNNKLKLYEGFYSYIFLRYEIIIKAFNNDLNEFFNYLYKNEIIYSYIKYEIWGKFLNEIKYEKYKDKFYPFIQMMIIRIIKSNDGNINQLIYYLFKTNNDEEYISIILKGIISYIQNKSNIKLNKKFFINLSLYKGKNIENKFIIIQILQLLYLNYNKKIKEIFSNDESNSQILHNILKNFLECNIIENKIQNNNEVIL